MLLSIRGSPFLYKPLSVRKRSCAPGTSAIVYSVFFLEDLVAEISVTVRALALLIHNVYTHKDIVRLHGEFCPCKLLSLLAEGCTQLSCSRKHGYTLARGGLHTQLTVLYPQSFDLRPL